MRPERKPLSQAAMLERWKGSEVELELDLLPPPLVKSPVPFIIHAFLSPSLLHIITKC